MNAGLRREWPGVLAAVVALLYIWVGLVAGGWDRLWGVAGGLIVLVALLVARRSWRIGSVLLLVGALPLAIATWWSIATPLLAVVVLSLGWVSVRTLDRSRRLLQPRHSG